MGISAKFAILLIFAFLSYVATTKGRGQQNLRESEWTTEKPEQHWRENAIFADPRTALAEFEPILIDP
jgi:hypothetical protein